VATQGVCVELSPTSQQEGLEIVQGECPVGGAGGFWCHSFIYDRHLVETCVMGLQTKPFIDPRNFEDLG
jgi:hypothetical protein